MKQGFNRACCLLQLVSRMLHVYILRPPFDVFLVFLSLNSHPSNLVLSSPYELEIESKLNVVNFSSTPARASMVVHGPAFLLIYFVSKFWLPVSIKWMASLELAAGFDLAPFRKNELESSILPQDHGVLAQVLIFIKSKK